MDAICWLFIGTAVVTLLANPLFGLLALGGTIGAILGPWLASRLAELLGSSSLLLVAVAFLGLGVVAAWVVAYLQPERKVARAAAVEADTDEDDEERPPAVDEAAVIGASSWEGFCRGPPSPVPPGHRWLRRDPHPVRAVKLVMPNRSRGPVLNPACIGDLSMRCFLAGLLDMVFSSEGFSLSRWIRPRPGGGRVGLGNVRRKALRHAPEGSLSPASKDRRKVMESVPAPLSPPTALPSGAPPPACRPTVRCRAALAGLALALAPTVAFTAPEAAGAQENGVEARPSVEATRIPDGTDVRIDGHLNEEVWSLAEPLTDFRQQDPVEGGLPSEPTEIRLLFDSHALYIGAMFYDSDPSGILAHQLERNAGLGTDDRFMWILDTFQDGRTGYFFEINPAGLMGDGLIGGGGGGLNKRWDGIWEVRTQILPNGWSAEIRIPFSTLNFDSQGDTWGINFQRTIRRKSEEILWSGWRRNESLFRPVSAGELRGLEGINQGVGVEVRPYVVAHGNQSPALGTGWDTEAKVGMDLSYSITPSLRAGVTVNTDFAEVEVDQRRVNLTRFPLQFPEQRGFFLEGSGVHSFNWANPFFSRRIGLVQGQEVPIRYGARLGGNAGRYELGFYQIRTGEAPLELGGIDGLWPTEDFTVGRVRRSLFQQSHVGAVYTRRSTAFDPVEGPRSEGLPGRHTVGGDFNLFTSQALGRFNAQIEGFMIFHTDPTGEVGFLSPDHRSRGYRWSFPNDLIRLHSSYRDFGRGWDPAVGFAPRRGFRRHQPTLTIAPRPQWIASVRQMEHQFYFEYLTDWDNRLLTRLFRVQPLQVNFESGDRFGFQVEREFERLERTFTIYESGEDSVVIPEGDYYSWGWGVGGQTAGRRTLSGSVDLGRSDFWDGERTQFDLRGTVRPRRGVSISTDYQRNEVRLEQGAFDTNLVRLSGSWNLSPLTSFTGNIQYDDVSRVVGLFARARWIVRPGSDVFLVWTHNWRNEVARLLDREFVTLSRGGAVKVNYSYRF